MTPPHGSNLNEQINDERLPYTVIEVDGVRELTHTFTREDGSTVELRRAHKIGITHWYGAARRSEPIPLYAGPFSLDVDGEKHGYEGTVEFVWGPQPAIKIAGVRDDLPSIDDIQRVLTGSVRVWVSAGVLSLPNSSAVPPQPPADASQLANPNGHPTLSNRTNLVTVGVATGFDRLTFLVPNGWEATDGFEVGDPGNPLRSLPGGVLASNAEWEVFLHPRLEGDSNDRQRALAEHGGYDVTHIGQIRRLDGAIFDDEQAWALTTTLRLCMSLACGRTTTPLLPVSWAADTPIAARWNGPPVDAWRNVGTWLDQSTASTQLKDLIVAALDYCADLAQQQLLRHAVSFLVTANYDTDVELSVAVPVSGLQMLSYVRFVEQRQQITAKDFKNKLDTEAQIRKLICDCNIDVSIPAHFAELRSAALKIQAVTGEKTVRDALSTIVFMRNKIIHPTSIRPDHWTIYQWAEASMVARHLLTLAILNAVGYSGVQHSPLSPDRWVGSLEAVPWAQQPTSSV